jgi:hypothetical protein
LEDLGKTTYVAVQALLFGGPGADDLDARGSSANNALVGGDGNDVLRGGNGRDLLIGGAGADALLAGSGSDILIGGSTDFDSDPAKLTAILATWSNTGLSYQARIDALMSSTGGNLNAGTVHADSAVDHLTGGPGLDWYLATVGGPYADVLNGRKHDEVVTAV